MSGDLPRSLALVRVGFSVFAKRLEDFLVGFLAANRGR